MSVKTIYRAKRILGLTQQRFAPWKKDEIRKLVKNYSVNPKIFGLFKNRTRMAIFHKASKLGLNRITNFHFRKYNTDVNFFDSWSPEAAYVFGLLCSDGTVGSDKRHFGWHIHKKDVELLMLIKKFMKSSNPIAIRGDYAEFKIYNKKLVRKLIELGCTPKKALRLKFPNIPDAYLNYFVRGYFDGDGSISFNKPNTIRISLLGTEFFLSKLQNILKSTLGFQKVKLKKYKNIYILNYYGNRARNFCRWLYERNNDMLLERKYDRYLNHLRLRFLNGRS